MRILGPLALIVGALGAHAGTPLSPTDFESCINNAPSRADQSQCEMEVMEALEKELVTAERDYRAAFDHFFEAEEKHEVHFRDRAYAAFDASAKAFREYRKHLCSVTVAWYGSGTGAGNGRMKCEFDMTNERIKMLRGTQNTK